MVSQRFGWSCQWIGSVSSTTAGLVIQAGPRPEPAPEDEDFPARLVLPDMLLQPIRAPARLIELRFVRE